MKGKYINLLHKLSYDELKDKHASMPAYAIPKPTFRTDSSNALTKAVMKWVALHGGFAARINTTGLYKESIQKWIPSGSTNGFPDIVAIHKGKFIGLEIKHGRDTLSMNQIKVSTEIVKAGGVWRTVTDFEEFAEWYLNEVVKKEEVFYG